MNKACLTRSLSSICLGKQTKQAEIQTTQGTPSTLVRRRNSLTRMHSQATGSHVEPSQTGQIPQGAEALARIPRLREHPLQAPGPHSPLATAPTVTSATPVEGSSAMPHAVLCMTAAAGSRSLPNEMLPGQIKGWVWLAEQIVAAKRYARELKHQYHEADPDADERDDLACQLKCAQARLQFLTTLEERLRATARAGEAQTSDDTVWKLNHLSPERMPIEFLELLPSSATVIELAGNRIKVIPDGTFERFRRLERLGLSGNQLGTLSRQSLRGLEGLTELDLSSNAIATIDPDGLAGLGALRKLRLDSNNLRRFPCLPKALEEANLSANAISVISPQHLEGLSRLKSLNLNNNRLERFKPPVAGLKALKVLCLGYNQLTQLDRSLMRLLPNLRTLVLADNSLREITRESMQGPPAYPSRLSNLSLADNAIRHLEAGAFREMMALQVLDLENNRLSELPDILPRTPALMRVNLSNNMLRRVDNDIFSGLPNLGRIDLSQNQITEIGEQILGQPTGMSHTAVIHIQLQDNALQQFPAGMLRHGWIRVDLYNNRFTQAEAARLEAGPHAAGILCLSNFSRHEREFTRWLGKPMTSLLAGVRYVTGVDSLYEFLHTVRHIVSHRAALPMALQDKRERILANVLDRVEALLPGLVANQTLAAQCFEALQSGLKGCGDRAMLAWWLLEIECRKQGILLASPDRQQLVQLGIWLHRLEKLLQFAKVLSARSTGNTAEAVEIQLWLLEALHHQVLGDLGRAGDTSMQILYKSAVLVHNRDLLEIQRQIAVAESANDYPDVLAAYLQTQQFWQAHLADDPTWRSMVRVFGNRVEEIEKEYRAASLELMECHDYDAGDAAYRAAQTALDRQRAQDLSEAHESHARRTTAPVAESLQALAQHARNSSAKPDTVEAVAQRHAIGWQWLDDQVRQACAAWMAVKTDFPERSKRRPARAHAAVLRARFQCWKSQRGALRDLHKTLASPTYRAFDFSNLGLLEFPVALLGLLPEQTTFIKLSDNAIEHLPDNAFSRFPELEYLLLGGNRLTALEEKSLQGLRRLRYLDLSDNLLTTIAPTAFKDLVALEECNARKNALTAFPRLPRGIRSACFDRNKIGYLGADALRGLHQLTQLHLKNNRIAVLDLPAGGLQALRELDVSGNQLVAFSLPVHRMPKLVSLNLSYNRIVQVLPEALEQPAGRPLVLETLNLAGNLLQDLPLHIFRPLQHLSHLDLKRNGLTDLPRGYVSDMPALRYLDLRGNRITVLRTGSLSGLPNLTVLDLSHNRINCIAAAAFQGPTPVEDAGASHIRINLSHNHLDQLEEVVQWPVQAGIVLVDARYNKLSDEAVKAALLTQPNGVLLLLRNASGGTSHMPGSMEAGNDSRDGRA